jgi:zinc transport system permease protein
MMDLFTMEFFRYALIMSVLLAILFGLLSFFAIMRKMAFLGAGIAHTAFGGVALGVFIGIDPFYTSLVFCILSALIIGKMVRYGNISYDTSIGIFFAFSMAMGAILIAMRRAYTFDLAGYLFGNILGVTIFDMISALIVLILFVPFLLLFLQKILFMTFDEKVANISGIPVQKLDTFLLVFFATIIVVSIKIVGIVLVSALVVLPASFGLIFSKDFRRVITISILFTLTIMIGGLYISYQCNTPAGATIVVIGTLIYFLCFIANYLRNSYI